jgi:hypothetical protein
MQTRISWHPLVSLRTVYWWSAGREMFYQTAAKAVAVDRVVSLLAMVALLAGVVCLATRPFTVAGPIWGLLFVVVPMAWQHAKGRALLHGCVAVGLMATYRNISAPIIALIVGNLLAASLIVIERRLHRQWLFKPLYLGNTNVGTARLLQGNVEIAHLFVGTTRPRRASHARATMKRVACACRWLVKEGRRFGMQVDFTHRQIAAMDGGWTTEAPSDKNGYAGILDFELFLDRQLAAANWPPAELADEDPRANRCLMVHVAGWTDERAFAMPTTDGRVDSRPKVEYALVGAGDNAATLAHELLHLFGADDFYFEGRYDQGWYAGQVGEMLDAGRFRFLERCVMFRSGVPLRELSVDDQTAQKIGWL